VVAFALQVPWISSPLVTYRFTAGFQLSAGIIGGGLTASFRLGSDFHFFLLQPHPVGLGINVAALAVLVFLLLAIRRQPVPPSLPREAGAD
jgi:hypothetical protein